MKTPAILALALVLSAGLAGSAFAEKGPDGKPGADWMPKEQLLQKLEAAGYSNLKGLEADDGHWEGEGTKNGAKMEFRADPRTGELLSEKLDHDDDDD